MSIPILMPALSPTMEEGTLAKWLVKEGDQISAGDLIAEIETDKATMEVEAVDEGIMGPLLIAEGTESVAVNSPIGSILAEGEKAGPAPEPAPKPTPPPASAPVATTRAQATPSPSPAPTAEVQPVAVAPQVSNMRTSASPLAKRMAEQSGLALNTISGSGPNGRIVKRDVEVAQSGAPSAPTVTPTLTSSSQQSAEIVPIAPHKVPATLPPGDYIEVPHDAVRKIVAKRLTESKQTVPHSYLTIDCEIDKVLALRRELNAKSPEGDASFKISVNDFIIRASALALKRVPDACQLDRHRDVEAPSCRHRGRRCH